MMHQHHHAVRAPLETVVSVVYVTASKTFEGPAAGFQTFSEKAQPTVLVGKPQRHEGSSHSSVSTGNGLPSVPVRSQRPNRENTSDSSIPRAASTTEPEATHESRTHSQTHDHIHTQITDASATGSMAQSTTLVAHTRASVQVSTSTPRLSQMQSSTATSPSSTPLTGSSTTSDSSSNGGMSAGGKVGLAFGIIAIIALMVGLLFFLYRKSRKNNEAHQRLDDEKSAAAGNAQSGGLQPRVSEKQDSQTASGMISVSAASASSQPRSPGMYNPATSNGTSEVVNPFGDHAAASSARSSAVLSNTAFSTLPGAAAGVKAGLSASGKTTNSRSSSSSSAVPPNNVHRVQLDFKPTMDDELELRAGQLVRMIHEYDDGWALCVRLDRSQQGVIPRNCISKLPVKPRAPGQQGQPPMHPNSRAQPGAGPYGPQAQSSRGSPRGPLSGSRPRAQSNAPYGGSQRSASPGPFASGQYTNSAPQNRPRATSASSAASSRRITPPAGSSPLNPTTTSPTQATVPHRKPVPGQAM